ncbi:DNA-processing protein DprA [Corynebacterium pseudotuberculosis]|uniref:DNA-processing protein DprA n=1 Tax=Corynebacterium pseudotuberculosis TaxID=1719 RepID=UPI000256B626|nr:DNA-processing protein DprA [Corynebacterium pseudotuberculosis]AFF22469.1 Rossmann-fold nucleotide-binding protein/SMF [Corynebacterium pseudotuberculosis P54B96]
MNDRLKAWAYLSRVCEGPNRELQRLLRQGVDAERIAYAIKKRETWLGSALLRATQARYECDSAQEDLKRIVDLGGRLITAEDDEWPRHLFNSAFGFAESGKSDHNRSYQEDAVMPHALWVVGRNLSECIQQSVSVVGTRAVSRYGRDATKLLVSGLVDHQYSIISGGALGVDAQAHTETLNRSGTTVVVAARGLDKAYPSSNAGLFRAVMQRGCIVSEYAPGLSPHRHRFLTRNRLVAALSLGTVVVEAAWRSGALNTLSWASALGRVAMAVPGPITTVGSLGCHERIRNHEAELVCSADEVRALISKIGEIDVNEQYEISFAPNAVQKLSRNELRIYDSLGAEPEVTEVIARRSGVSIGLAVHLLLELSNKGMVQREGAGWQRKVLFNGK